MRVPVIANRLILLGTDEDWVEKLRVGPGGTGSVRSVFAVTMNTVIDLKSVDIHSEEFDRDRYSGVLHRLQHWPRFMEMPDE